VVPEGKRRSELDRLRRPPFSPTTKGLVHALERLGEVRALGVDTLDLSGLPPRRVAGLARYSELADRLEVFPAPAAAGATLHVIGSNNGLAPWTGLGLTAPTPEQIAEVEARVAAALAWIDATFDAAEDADLLGVVLAMQADTWAPVPASAQQAIVQRIASRTAAFDGQVLLLQVDSHEYRVDNPLALDNFTRIVVQGEMLPFEYLRLTVDPRDPALFSWDRVPVAQPSPAAVQTLSLPKRAKTETPRQPSLLRFGRMSYLRWILGFVLAMATIGVLPAGAAGRQGNGRSRSRTRSW